MMGEENVESEKMQGEKAALYDLLSEKIALVEEKDKLVETSEQAVKMKEGVIEILRSQIRALEKQVINGCNDFALTL